jgi:hypothetical protein
MTPVRMQVVDAVSLTKEASFVRLAWLFQTTAAHLWLHAARLSSASA